MSDLEHAIRQRAYHLWLADGCRDGAADAYWLTAQREVLSASLSVAEVGTAVEMPQAAPAANEPSAKAKTVKPKAAKAKTDKPAAPVKTKRRAA